MFNLFLKKKILITIVLLPVLGSALLFFVEYSLYCNRNEIFFRNDEIDDKIDFIITFGGETPRLVYAAELLKKHQRMVWLVADQNEKYKRFAESLSDHNRIRFLSIHNSIINTKSEVLAIRQWLDSSSMVMDSINIGLLSTAYHMKRIQILSERYLQNGPWKYKFVSFPLNGYYDSFKYFFKVWKFEIFKIILLEMRII